MPTHRLLFARGGTTPFSFVLSGSVRSPPTRAAHALPPSTFVLGLGPHGRVVGWVRVLLGLGVLLLGGEGEGLGVRG